MIRGDLERTDNQIKNPNLTACKAMRSQTGNARGELDQGRTGGNFPAFRGLVSLS